MQNINIRYYNNPKVVKYKNIVIESNVSDSLISAKLDSSHTSIYYYNKNNLIRFESRKPNNELGYWITHNYDKKNRLTNKTFYYKDSSINYSNTYYYNKFNKTDSIKVETKKGINIVRYQFDNNGNITGLTNNNLKRLYNSANLTYDDNNRASGKKFYDENNKLKRSVEYIRYNNGKVKISKVYSSRGSILHETYYEYNKNGDESFRKNYRVRNNDTIIKFIETTKYEYDKYKNKTKSTTTDKLNNSIMVIETFDYRY